MRVVLRELQNSSSVPQMINAAVADVAEIIQPGR